MNERMTALECPEYLINTYSVSADGLRFDYAGIIHQPHFDEDLNLVCRASIGKKKVETVSEHRRFSLRRCRMIDVPESTHETSVWFCESEGNSYYAIHSDGTPARYTEGSYRWYLLDALRLHQHYITPKLFSIIFDGLDRQLLEFFLSARPDLNPASPVRAVS